MKFKSHVDQLKALNIFTLNDFHVSFNQAIKPSSRLKLFNIYIRPRIDYSTILWYNSNLSSLNGLWWNAVKTIISSKYNRFYKHVTFALLNFPCPQTIFFENVLRYLTSVACNRSLNLVIMDEYISVCRNFPRYFNCKGTRGNDGLTGSLREFWSSKSRENLKTLNTKLLSSYLAVRDRFKIRANRLLWNENWQ